MKRRISLILTDPNDEMRQRIERVREDLRDIQNFYNIRISTTRRSRFQKFYTDELGSLQDIQFNSLNQEGKIDYLLLQNFLKRNLYQICLDADKDEKMEPLLSFAPMIMRLCEERQVMKAMDGKKAAQEVYELGKQIAETKVQVRDHKIKVDKMSAFRAAKTIDELRSLLEEWYGFFKGYDPLFSWWVAEPYEKVQKDLDDLPQIIRQKLVGIDPNDKDAIVGDPIGREGLLADLNAEMIPYSPEELLEIGETEFVWCETEMTKASKELGYSNWREALAYVKGLYVEPGKKPELVHFLAIEAIDYVEKHDLITVPSITKETWRMFMMSPQQCIDFLVEKVGHERSTAEGEVRRSFNGDYTPLYQAGYMLGALQLYVLRQEIVENGKLTEKQFHDRVMKENEMPIELLRALIKDQLVTPDFKTSWRFYEGR